MMSAETNRAVFLSAVTEEQMSVSARAAAMVELVTASEAEGTKKLPADLHKALVTATASPDCDVAAAAARTLVQHGEPKFAPSRPHVRKERTAPNAPAPKIGHTLRMMRAICVLASYEKLHGSDEPSYLPGYLPKKGLELVTVTYDPYNETDDDGDGDPHTVRTTSQVARTEATFPELEDLGRALKHCTFGMMDSACRSSDREFRFGFGPGPAGELLLQSLVMADLPPCHP
jgi:hypothetical protein